MEEIYMSKEITNVSINVLKVHPRNAEFFDDISGKEYEEFKKSILEDGIISEIIVAPDMTIISGHQRFKAAKAIGIPMVPIRIREDLIDEDKKLKVLLAANFQRPKNSEAKQRKVADEYVRLCGYGNGGNRQAQVQNGLLLSLDDIASQLGTSKTNLKRALRIERNLTDSMKELLDTGIITKSLAADMIATLSEEEQEKYFKIFIQRLCKDTRKNAGLGSKISRTHKRDYQRCIDHIEAWIPSCGCAELRAKADANAKARLEAKKLGYRK